MNSGVVTATTIQIAFPVCLKFNVIEASLTNEGMIDADWYQFDGRGCEIGYDRAFFSFSGDAVNFECAKVILMPSSCCRLVTSKKLLGFSNARYEVRTRALLKV